MAQSKKRAAARRGKVATRDKARKPAKSVHGKAAYRTRTKTAPRKRVTKTKLKRAMVKKAVPIVETVIVDMIEEPVPGVLAVTEVVTTGIRGSNANFEQLEERRGAVPPELEERMGSADFHRLQRPVDRLRDLIIADRARCARTRLVEETIDPLARKALAPTPDRALAGSPEPIVDGRVSGSTGHHQNYPRTKRQRVGYRAPSR